MDDSQPTSASEPTATARPRPAAPPGGPPAAGPNPLTSGVRRAGPATATRPRPTAPPNPAPAPVTWGDPHTPWDDEQTLLSWKLVGGILAVLLIGGLASYKLFGTTKATDAAKPDKVATAGQAPGGEPVPNETAGSDVTDAFAGTSTDGLGTAETGQVWETPTGTWGKADGHAYLVQPNPDGGNRSIAVVDLGSGNGSVSAKVTQMTPGWGLVFRYKGAFNYWMLQASPKFGTYNLVKIDDGKAVSVGNSGLSKQDPGTVVGVRFQGDQVTIVVNGTDAGTFTDGSFAGATKVGLLAADLGAKDAQWSAFTATKLSATPAPAAKKPATTPTSAGP